MTKAPTASDGGFDVSRDLSDFVGRQCSAASPHQLAPTDFLFGASTHLSDAMKIGNLNAPAIQNISRSRRPSFGYTGQALSQFPTRQRPFFWAPLGEQVEKE